MSRARRILLVAVPVVLVGAAVAVWMWRSGDGSSSPEVRWTDCRIEVAESADGARCGLLDRPLDTTRPALGSIDVGFELYAHTGAGAAVGTIVAHEGGPGYATTASRDYFLELFGPLLADHDLLLPDARGTGLSGAIDCPELQGGTTEYVDAVGACGRQLGEASDAYGSAPASDDLAALLDALDLRTVDLYGVSYGTFLAQTFAYRHPDRVRTLMLDSAFPATGLNPWYPDTSQAIRDALTFVCERDPECVARGIDPVTEVRKAADVLHDSPLEATAAGAEGTPVDVTVDGIELAGLLANATFGGPVYREIGAAVRALDAGDPLPLARLVAEAQGGSGEDLPVDYSAGSYIAVICNDYPVLWDRSAALEERNAQYETARDSLKEADPEVFSPVGFDDWIDLQWGEDQTCMQWPAPTHFVEAVAADMPAPSMPTLILTSDLDSITSPFGNGVVAEQIPDSHLVVVRNGVHAMSIADSGRCASSLVVEFVVSGGATPDAGCAATDYPEVHTLAAYPQVWDDVVAAPGEGTETLRRLAALVVATLGDVWGRYFSMLGDAASGLRGGEFTIGDDEVLTFELDGYRFVEDIAISGSFSVDITTGEAQAQVTLVGDNSSPSPPVEATVTYSIWAPGAVASLTFTIGGATLEASVPAP